MDVVASNTGRTTRVGTSPKPVAVFTLLGRVTFDGFEFIHTSEGPQGSSANFANHQVEPEALAKFQATWKQPWPILALTFKDAEPCSPIDFVPKAGSGVNWCWWDQSMVVPPWRVMGHAITSLPWGQWTSTGEGPPNDWAAALRPPPPPPFDDDGDHGSDDVAPPASKRSRTVKTSSTVQLSLSTAFSKSVAAASSCGQRCCSEQPGGEDRGGSQLLLP